MPLRNRKQIKELLVLKWEYFDFESRNRNFCFYGLVQESYEKRGSQIFHETGNLLFT